jgi:periplasmic divalent cation tolerance protein
MPVTARRTFSCVNSSATIARHPEVPNLICARDIWRSLLVRFEFIVRAESRIEAMTDARVVLTTAGSADEARKVARLLVDQRLAACVNIVPQIESVYRWQNKVESAAEWLLIIKTTAARFPAVRDAIRANHPYDLPECICLTVDAGDENYLKWLKDSSAESSS